MRLKVLAKKYILTFILTVVGLIGGFMYWKYIGCASGTCAIKSNMLLMTGYGGLIGGLFGNIFKGFNRKKG